MESSTKTPREFSWKITAEPRSTPGAIPLQEQCSCGSGGGAQCQGQCGGGKCGGGKE